MPLLRHAGTGLFFNMSLLVNAEQQRHRAAVGCRKRPGLAGNHRPIASGSGGWRSRPTISAWLRAARTGSFGHAAGLARAFTLESPGTKVMSLALCGPHRLGTGGSDNLIRIWDLKQRGSPPNGRAHMVFRCVLGLRWDLLISAATTRPCGSGALPTGELGRCRVVAARDRVGSRWESRPKK